MKTSQLKRIDELDPLDYTEEMPSLMSAWGRVDIHSVCAKFLADNHVTGAYLEFGVGSGRSAVSAIRAYWRAGVCNRFVLFDSFAGLPELRESDTESIQFKKGDYAYTEAEVFAFLAEHGIDSSIPVTMVPGWFDDSIKSLLCQQKPLRSSVVHIDVDLYASCRDVLEAVTESLGDGTIMLFDDWNCFSGSSSHGERRAFAEWCLRHPYVKTHAYCSYGWHGQAFIVEIGEVYP